MPLGIDPQFIAFGLIVGILVGLTGIGGGSLMTPLLLLAGGVPPTVAVGTDLAYGAVTKTVGGWRHLRAGTTHGAMLFLPNVTRAFFVLVMSSSAGAAIGVTEAITVILREAEHLPELGDRLVLFALGIVLFGIPLQVAFAVIGLIQRRVARAAAARAM